MELIEASLFMRPQAHGHTFHTKYCAS